MGNKGGALVLFIGRCWRKAATVQAMNLVTASQGATKLHQTLVSLRLAKVRGGVGNRCGRCERFEQRVVTSMLATRRCSTGQRACFCPASRSELIE